VGTTVYAELRFRCWSVGSADRPRRLGYAALRSSDTGREENREKFISGRNGTPNIPSGSLHQTLSQEKPTEQQVAGKRDGPEQTIVRPPNGLGGSWP